MRRSGFPAGAGAGAESQAEWILATSGWEAPQYWPAAHSAPDDTAGGGSTMALLFPITAGIFRDENSLGFGRDAMRNEYEIMMNGPL